METLRETLLWCTVLNYGLLIYWYLVLLIAHDWIFAMHGKWFHLSRERFDAIHYGGMLLYKLAVTVFNFVPYIVLRFIV